MTGWFSVKHGIRKHPIFAGKPERLGAWIAILDEAAWRDTKQVVGGVEIQVKRGQLCASQAMLMEYTGLTRQKLRDFLRDLEKDGVIHRQNPTKDLTKEITKPITKGITKGITKQITKARTIITICNYDKYQLSPDSEKPSEKPSVQPSEKPSRQPKAQPTIQPIKEQVYNKPTSISSLRSEIEDAEASAEFCKIDDRDHVKTALWAAGKSYLSSRGVLKPGPIIGRWLKSSTPTQIFEAIQAAQKEETEDPISYITAALKGGSKASRYNDARDSPWFN